MSSLNKFIPIAGDKEWCRKIVKCFYENFDAAFEKVGNKHYGATTIAQMSAALTAAKIKVEDVDYREVAAIINKPINYNLKQAEIKF